MTPKEQAETIRKRLEILGPVKTKNMFGTIAFVNNGIFFGSLSKGKLYFKTDDDSIKMYKKYNMSPFTSHGKSMDYFEVPQEVIDNDDLFHKWAEKALKAANAKKAK